ncbi:MAG: macro domain-containing protein [Clostridium sp.]
MPLEIVRNDITLMDVDAIVNAANIRLLNGAGVCGAIFKEAGALELQKECNKIGVCKVGHAVITKGYKLKAKYIIHTVGPMWSGGNANEEKLLYNAYQNSLKLGKENGCKSIAFPLISTGVYGYPKAEGLRVATNAIRDFLMHEDMNVYLVIFDKQAYKIGESLFSDIKGYIDDNYVDENLLKRSARRLYDFEYYDVYESPMEEKLSLMDRIEKLDESFSQMLLRLIDEKGMSDAEAYKKANMDRKLFSKIRSNKNYNPKKQTAISFAIALELNLDQTLDLLGKAGYTLSNSSRFDVIIQYFIEKKNYNIFEINEVLFEFDEPILR